MHRPIGQAEVERPRPVADRLDPEAVLPQALDGTDLTRALPLRHTGGWYAGPPHLFDAITAPLLAQPKGATG